MTQPLPDKPVQDSPGFWRLMEIVLDRCSVEKRDGDAARPASVDQNEFTIQALYTGSVLEFRVGSQLTFEDEDDAVVAFMTAEFRARYFVGKEAPNPEDVSKFQPSVVVQVAPFMREFTASMASRLGIPQFFMPLVRRNELRFVDAIESDADELDTEAQLPAE